jgi:hypothetical protein
MICLEVLSGVVEWLMLNNHKFINKEIQEDAAGWNASKFTIFFTSGHRKSLCSGLNFKFRVKIKLY